MSLSVVYYWQEFISGNTFDVIMTERMTLRLQSAKHTRNVIWSWETPSFIQIIIT